MAIIGNHCTKRLMGLKKKYSNTVNELVANEFLMLRRCGLDVLLSGITRGTLGILGISTVLYLTEIFPEFPEQVAAGHPREDPEQFGSFEGTLF